MKKLNCKILNIFLVSTIIFFGTFFLHNTIFAAPNISSVSGTWNHKGTIIINGSNFGTKSQAAPIVWDDATGQDITSKWDLVWPNCGSNIYYTDYRVPQRGIELPHQHISKYIAGSHGGTGSAGCGAAVMLWKSFTISYPFHIYSSWYNRADDAWVFGDDNNYKVIDWTNGSGGYDLPNNWYLEANNSTLTSRNASPWYHFIDDSGYPTGLSLTSPDINGHSWHWDSMVNPMAGSWTKVETEMNLTNTNSGRIRVWENGMLRVDYNGKTDGYSGNSRSFGIGGYARMYGQPNNWRYWADIYLDTSFSRVVLANNSNIDNANVKEMQIPSSWNNNSITLSSNLGRFTSGQTAYLFVYDSTGTPSATGYPVTIGTPTPDTTPPTSPTGLSASATSQSSITVTWTAATDNIGVSNYIVERCQGPITCTTFTQVGTPTTSPFVDSGLTPSTEYSYHVQATDAAGNLSGWSNVVGATTQAPDTQAPTTPTNLSATASSSSQIDLTWTASTDNVGVTGYKVERCSGASCSNFTQVGTPTPTSYSDTGLSATTLYRYQVRATDGAGNNSSYSTIASATTPQAPPSPTFVSEYETTWNSSSSPKTTANFSVQSGDILVAYAVNESSSNTIATPPTGTLTGTWTLKQTIAASNFTYLRLWTMNVSSNQTNVNVSFTNGGGNFGGDVLQFRNASGIGITAQANNSTGNPALTLTGIGDNSTIVMVNGDWSAKTGARTYNTISAGSFTETSAYADESSYGVEAGYYANAGTSGNKTIGITAPSGMTWALAAVEVKGNPSTGTPTPCNTVTTSNFSQSAYNGYGAPYDAFQTSTNLINASCSSSDSHTIQATLGQTGDTTRIVYTKGYYYDPGIADWHQFTGTCTGALNGEWCQGSITASITDTDISTASAIDPAYFVGMTCSIQGGGWKCGCRDTSCSNFYWQVQGAGL